MPVPIQIPPAIPTLPPPDDLSLPPTKPPLGWWEPGYVPPGIIPLAPPPRPVVIPN